MKQYTTEEKEARAAEVFIALPHVDTVWIRQDDAILNHYLQDTQDALKVEKKISPVADSGNATETVVTETQAKESDNAPVLVEENKDAEKNGGTATIKALVAANKFNEALAIYNQLPEEEKALIDSDTVEFLKLHEEKQ